MTEFFEFNLWMFFVIGVLGAALCYLRSSFVWWVVPAIIVVSILFLFQIGEITADLGVATRPGWVKVAISILFALACPIAGALGGRRSRGLSQAI